MTEAPSPSKVPVPRGMILVALLFSIAAAALVAAAALPDDALAGVPRSALFSYALALGVVATGLFRKRRWAWWGLLSFVFVNIAFLYRGVLQGQNQIIGLTILAVLAGYTFLPGVRRVYLGR